MLVLAKPSIHTAPLRNARKKSANTRLGSHRSPRFDSIPYSFRTDAERKAEPTQSDTVPYTHGVAISNAYVPCRARRPAIFATAGRRGISGLVVTEIRVNSRAQTFRLRVRVAPRRDRRRFGN